jgi:endonuclease G
MLMRGETQAMGVLDRALKDQLLDALIRVPIAESRDGRTALLDGIPHDIRIGLNRSDTPYIDLTRLIDQIDQLGRLDNGERPVVILTNNAWRMTRGSELGRRLEELVAEIEKKYGFEPPLVELPDTPEVLIFGGEGEWVEGDFMTQAQVAGRQVARLLIPRFVDGEKAQGTGHGTGWLVAPRLTLTNYHVIEARDKKEKSAGEADFELQGKNTVAWLDYHNEGKFAGPSLTATAVIAASRELDYALLRLEDQPEVSARGCMKLAKSSPLKQGARLNIVQCPGGGPLRYAIRNNFFVGLGKQAYQLRYLTDTKSGSSGSPVLNDNWQVVAMHHGAKEVSPEAYKGEDGKKQVAKFHNEGIAIHAILADLPQEVRQEIELAQSKA